MFSLQPYDANVPSSYTVQGAVPAGSSEQNATPGRCRTLSDSDSRILMSKGHQPLTWMCRSHAYHIISKWISL